MKNWKSTGSASNRQAHLALRIAIILAILSAPIAALAGKRIVVLDFEGPRARSFHRAVERIVEKKHNVISHRKYMRVAKRLKAGRPTAENVQRVTAELSADGVVVGVVERRRGRYVLTLKLRAGADGAFGEDIVVRSRRPKLRGRDLREVRRKLLAAIEALPSSGVIELDEPVVLEEPVGEDAGDGQEVAPEPAPSRPAEVAARPAEAEANAIADDNEIADANETVPQPSSREPIDAIDLTLGMSFVARQLDFNVAANLGPASPQGYDGAPVAGAYIEGSFYPLALISDGFLANIGVTGVYDRVIEIKSTLNYNADGRSMTANLGTTQQHWGVGAVLRYALGSGPKSPTVRAHVRYNRLSFQIAKDEAPAGVMVDIPNVDYTYIDPGVGLRYPLTNAVALGLDARFMVITDTGEMQSTEQYGAATVFGGEGEVMLEYRFLSAVSARLGGLYRTIGFDFDGNGALTRERDGDPQTEDVGGARDVYVGGYLALGLTF